MVSRMIYEAYMVTIAKGSAAYVVLIVSVRHYCGGGFIPGVSAII